MHASKGKECRTAETFWLSQRLRQTGGQQALLDLARDERATNRLVEIEAHLGGFFRAIGSVLDNLAGIVIVVAGLSCNLVRADFRHLQLDKPATAGMLSDGDGRRFQLALVDAVRTSVQTGPPGWQNWVEHMRNSLVHRARRLSFELTDRDGKGSLRVIRPLPRDPDQTDAESTARAQVFAADLIQQDAKITIDGLLALMDKVVADTTRAATAAWDERRNDPSVVRQPIAQWPKIKQGKQAGFEGFPPLGLPRLDFDSLHLHPSRATRFAAAKFRDGDRVLWDTWLAASDD